MVMVSRDTMYLIEIKENWEDFCLRNNKVAETESYRGLLYLRIKGNKRDQIIISSTFIGIEFHTYPEDFDKLVYKMFTKFYIGEVKCRKKTKLEEIK